MPVLLGRPRARPAGPGRGGRARLVPDAVEGVEHRHVGRQGLLGDHVADEHDEVVVGELVGALAQLADLVDEVGRARVGQEVGGLPAGLRVLEDRVDLVLDVVVDGADDLEALGGDGVQDLVMFFFFFFLAKKEGGKGGGG